MKAGWERLKTNKENSTTFKPEIVIKRKLTVISEEEIKRKRLIRFNLQPNDQTKAVALET